MNGFTLMFAIAVILICFVIYLILYPADDSEKKSTANSKPKLLYVCNNKSNVFHRPNCPCVKNMSEYDLNGDIVRNNSCSDYRTLIAIGYKPCNKCKPR